MIVSGEEWRNPAIHTHTSILPQPPLPSRLPHNIEQSPYAIQYNINLSGIGFPPTFHFFSCYGRIQVRFGHMSRWIRMQGQQRKGSQGQGKQAGFPSGTDQQSEDRDIYKLLA